MAFRWPESSSKPEITTIKPLVKEQKLDHEPMEDIEEHLTRESIAVGAGKGKKKSKIFKVLSLLCGILSIYAKPTLTLHLTFSKRQVYVKNRKPF